MKLLTIYCKNGNKITTPIENIQFLEFAYDDFYVHLPGMYVSVGRRQFETIKEIMEETE